jgi:acetate kinase
MSEAILSINAGSSSIKFSIYAIRDGRNTIALHCQGDVTAIGHDARLVARNPTGHKLAERPLGASTTLDLAMEAVLAWIDCYMDGHKILAAGHRVVHGGDEFDSPVLVDDDVLAALKRFVPMAPSHQPHNLAAIRALARLHPQMDQVACFDTAFHQTQPTLARTYALPREITASGVRGYGFHGLSYEYIASVLPHYAGDAADGKVVVAHLGHGASMCAMRGRRSVATTMGFTALDGLPMGKRCGALDPGIIPYLVREHGMKIEDVEDLLYDKSGLLGVSGLSDDMRTLLANDDPAAVEAVDLFCYRIGRELGSLAGALGGLDVLVFTGGIGEHAAAVRSKVCAAAGWLGVEIDEDANNNDGPSLGTGTTAVFVIPTNEDLMIARHTLAAIRPAKRTQPAPQREPLRSMS